MQASKDHGPDPNSNARLATLIAGAKKSGFPKSSIENAIARGQGLSPTGAALEMVTVEAMLSSMAVIIECQTVLYDFTCGIFCSSQILIVVIAGL